MVKPLPQYHPADDAEAVKAVNDEAGIPYTRVVEAHDLTPA